MLFGQLVMREICFSRFFNWMSGPLDHAHVAINLDLCSLPLKSIEKFTYLRTPLYVQLMRIILSLMMEWAESWRARSTWFIICIIVEILLRVLTGWVACTLWQIFSSFNTSLSRCNIRVDHTSVIINLAITQVIANLRVRYHGPAVGNSCWSSHHWIRPILHFFIIYYI